MVSLQSKMLALLTFAPKKVRRLQGSACPAPNVPVAPLLWGVVGKKVEETQAELM